MALKILDEAKSVAIRVNRKHLKEKRNEYYKKTSRLHTKHEV